MRRTSRDHTVQLLGIKTLSVCPQAFTEDLAWRPPDVVIGPQVICHLSSRELSEDISKHCMKYTVVSLAFGRDLQK